MRKDKVGAGGAYSPGAPQLFSEIGRLTLSGRLRQKECTKSCELTLKINFFLHF